MRNEKLNMPQADNSVSENNGIVNPFEALERNFERAYASGSDYTTPLYDLATAIAHAVLNKCIDPQRTSATKNDTVSNNGLNPSLTETKRGIAIDRHLLDNTAKNANDATDLVFNRNGDLVSEVVDKKAESALGDLIERTLSDGIDLVHDAIVALLEQAAEHAVSGEGWLDAAYTTRALSKKVYIQLEDSAAYKDVETTPIQEVYRVVRRSVQSSRAVQADPCSGYLYIEDLTEDGLDAIYYRLGKHADLGGYDCNGNYTASTVAGKKYLTILQNLTPRQRTIVELRVRGWGYKAIGTYLGVTFQCVHITLDRLYNQLAALGSIPLDLTMEEIEEDREEENN